MKLFRVSWLDRTGRKRIRRGWALRPHELKEAVHKEGGRIVSIEPCPKQAERGRLSLRLKPMSAIAAMDQLAMQLDAGLPLDVAVGSLARESDDAKVQQLMAGVYDQICRSGDVASGFSRFPKQFPAHVVEMIEVGHRAGRLPETFSAIARHWEEMEEARGVAAKAMTYPVIAGVVMLGITLFLLGFVLPSFARVFADLGVELPGLTRFYLSLSHFVTDHAVLLAGVAGIAMGLAIAFRGYAPMRQWAESKLAMMPVVGPFIQAVAVVRLTSNLGTLTHAGIPTQDALKVCALSTGNARYDQAIGEALSVLGRGYPLSMALQRTGVFPGIMITSLRVGEVANRLGEALEKVRAYHSRVARTLLQSRLQLIEPVLTLSLGVFVGSVAVSLFYPMLTLALNIRR